MSKPAEQEKGQNHECEALLSLQLILQGLAFLFGRSFTRVLFMHIKHLCFNSPTKVQSYSGIHNPEILKSVQNWCLISVQWLFSLE